MELGLVLGLALAFWIYDSRQDRRNAALLQALNAIHREVGGTSDAVERLRYTQEYAK